MSYSQVSESDARHLEKQIEDATITEFGETYCDHCGSLKGLLFSLRHNKNCVVLEWQQAIKDIRHAIQDASQGALTVMLSPLSEAQLQHCRVHFNLPHLRQTDVIHHQWLSDTHARVIHIPKPLYYADDATIPFAYSPDYYTVTLTEFADSNDSRWLAGYLKQTRKLYVAVRP